MTIHNFRWCIFERKNIMKKYVKFTDGKGVDLTKNKAYEIIGNSKAGNPRIIDDSNTEITVRHPKGGCSHLSGNCWHFCDENGVPS